MVHRYFIIHKPIDMVSQFVSSHVVRLLTDLDFSFPIGTHAIGRLDQNSEGLLLLTTNKKITKLLFQGSIPHKRTYYVQVKNRVSLATIKHLSEGILISAPNGTQFLTTPCEVEIVEKPNFIGASPNPLHPNVLSTWLKITLTEGKYHQVRKMVAAVNHRCLRLVRTSIENIHLTPLLPGQVYEVTEEFFFTELKLK